MFLSTTDAKAKYCPFLPSPGDKFRVCQGAACMMWRWSPEDSGGGAMKMEGKGFCGLAGVPFAVRQAAGD